MLLHKFNWAIFKYSEIQIAKSATVEGEGALLGIRAMLSGGYSWQRRPKGMGFAIAHSSPSLRSELCIPAKRYMTFRPEAVKMKKELINLNHYPMMKGG